jgi:hypothetical protein
MNKLLYLWALGALIGIVLISTVYFIDGPDHRLGTITLGHIEEAPL